MDDIDLAYRECPIRAPLRLQGARAREEGVVRARACLADPRVLPRGVNPVREEDGDDLRVRVDPEARPGEAEVAEAPRTEERPGARALRALSIEPGAQRPARPLAHEP